MKLTEEDKQEIENLRESGMKIADIAEKFKVSSSTIRYHLNSDCRERVLERAKKRWKDLPQEKKTETYRKRRAYLREYSRNRYWKNKEWRKKRIQISMEYKRKKRLERK